MKTMISSGKKSRNVSHIDCRIVYVFGISRTGLMHFFDKRFSYHDQICDSLLNGHKKHISYFVFMLDFLRMYHYLLKHINLRNNKYMVVLVMRIYNDDKKLTTWKIELNLQQTEKCQLNFVNYWVFFSLNMIFRFFNQCFLPASWKKTITIWAPSEQFV